MAKTECRLDARLVNKLLYPYSGNSRLAGQSLYWYDRDWRRGSLPPA